MSDKVISQANLNAIESNLSVLSRNIETIANNVSVVSDQIETVDKKVEVVYSEFQAFVNESKRIASLADAKQNVLMLEQELQKEFGHYETIRKHTTGILQASDINIVKKETITNVTEELMLAAPKYWLAPALIALSAWISDEKELADRALKEAIRRDDEKTSLMFCLIARRAGRLDASLQWLERYFGMQDPSKIERKVIVVLDAFASGVFGMDSKGLCYSKITAWIDELSMKAGFVESQRNQWSAALKSKESIIKDSEYTNLRVDCTHWNALMQGLQWSRTHAELMSYFNGIFNTPVNNIVSIKDNVDELLNSLVSNYDIEELPLRRDIRKNKLVIEENGHYDRAVKRFDGEAVAFESYVDFSQHLTNVSLSPESSGALISAQKLAISLSRDWIKDAYEGITAQSRSAYPIDVELKIEDWTGMTREGENENELVDSLKGHLENKKRIAINNVKLKAIHYISLVAGLLLLLPGLISLNILMIVLGLAGISVTAVEAANLKKKKQKVGEDFDTLIENSIIRLKALIAELVDFRREYNRQDANYDTIMAFFNGLTPDQYVLKGETTVRSVL